MGTKPAVEMGKLWDGEISSRTISRALKKIDFTCKKILMAFQEPDEAKRQAFIAKLSTIVPDKIVYVDESGMDDRTHTIYQKVCYNS
jgi:hypothetical protein